MAGFYYVYILESARGRHFYTGVTEDLEERLQRHNAGEVPHGEIRAVEHQVRRRAQGAGPGARV